MLVLRSVRKNLARRKCASLVTWRPVSGTRFSALMAVPLTVVWIVHTFAQASNQHWATHGHEVPSPALLRPRGCRRLQVIHSRPRSLQQTGVWAWRDDHGIHRRGWYPLLPLALSVVASENFDEGESMPCFKNECDNFMWRNNLQQHTRDVLHTHKWQHTGVARARWRRTWLLLNFVQQKLVWIQSLVLLRGRWCWDLESVLTRVHLQAALDFDSWFEFSVENVAGLLWWWNSVVEWYWFCGKIDSYW